MLEHVDVLSLHLPLTPTTKDLVNRDVFAKMKKSAVLLCVPFLSSVKPNSSDNPSCCLLLQERLSRRHRPRARSLRRPLQSHHRRSRPRRARDRAPYQGGLRRDLLHARQRHHHSPHRRGDARDPVAERPDRRRPAGQVAQRRGGRQHCKVALPESVCDLRSHVCLYLLDLRKRGKKGKWKRITLSIEFGREKACPELLDDDPHS